MLKKILVGLGIMILAVGTFSGGHYVGQSSNQNVAKIPVLSACLHRTDANMLRYMISGGELAEEAISTIDSLNTCWIFSKKLPDSFNWGKDKTHKAEQLHFLVEQYGNLVVSILKREEKLGILLNIIADKEMSKSRVNMAKLSTDSMMKQQLADVETIKIFLRSIDHKLIELWE